MESAELNYESLCELVNLEHGHHLEVVRRDVTRLGNTSSEIHLGQTVPFVATTDFVLTSTGARYMKVQNCAAGVTVMSIDSSGVVRCPVDEVAFDSRAAARWIAQHYDFKFRVRGLERSPFQPHSRDPIFEVDQYATVVPWIQEVNTSAVRGDAIEIDFDVKPRVPESAAGPHKALLTKAKLPIALDGDSHVMLELAIEGNYEAAAKLAGGSYWIALHSDERPDLKLAVKITSVDVPSHAALASAPLASGDRVAATPKDRSGKRHPNND